MEELGSIMCKKEYVKETYINSVLERESTITRYELIHIDLENTKLIFIESESKRNIFGKINSALVRVLFGKRQPEEFNKFIKKLEMELENNSVNL
nr:DUF3284 domain-containing protein [Clostridioides difficile]